MSKNKLISTIKIWFNEGYDTDFYGEDCYFHYMGDIEFLNNGDDGCIFNIDFGGVYSAEAIRHLNSQLKVNNLDFIAENDRGAVTLFPL